MTPKLIDRLARLEGAQAAADGAGELPREMVQAWLRAVAVALGGYPRTEQPGECYATDSLGDGFARGLGYRDRDEMEAQSTTAPEVWRTRVERAHADLRERYRADAGAATVLDDATALARAVDLYGAPSAAAGVAR